MSTLYPLFLSLRGRVCVVVGGNEMAEAKIQNFSMRMPTSVSLLPLPLTRLPRGRRRER